MPDSDPITVPLVQWGTDHWSTFAFAAHWCAEYGDRGFDIGTKMRQIRCDPELHPQFAHGGWLLGDTGSPTRLRGGKEITRHDDWSCLDDAEAVGLIRNEGTVLYPIIFITDQGLEVAARLAGHKTDGGSFGSFALGEGGS